VKCTGCRAELVEAPREPFDKLRANGGVWRKPFDRLRASGGVWCEPFDELRANGGL
jgi:hypothetical protein